MAQKQKKEIETLNNTLKAVCWARDLVNRPHSHLTATGLANAIHETCTPAGVKVTVLEKKKIESLKMGGLLAVNLGSEEPSTFTILEYKPKNFPAVIIPA